MKNCTDIKKVINQLRSSGMSYEVALTIILTVTNVYINFNYVESFISVHHYRFRDVWGNNYGDGHLFVKGNEKQISGLY